MARKDILSPIYVSATGVSPSGGLTQSLAASFNTVSTDVRNMDSVAYQINITTSNSTGNFFLQMSNDNVNFIDVGAAGTVGAANDSVLVEIDISRTAPFIRLRYAAGTAGTGTCLILITAKQGGG